MLTFEFYDCNIRSNAITRTLYHRAVDIIFRCQFYTGAIKDHGLVLEKTELDDACKGNLPRTLSGT